jgi:hypothetical protein
VASYLLTHSGMKSWCTVDRWGCPCNVLGGGVRLVEAHHVAFFSILAAAHHKKCDSQVLRRHSLSTPVNNSVRVPFCVSIHTPRSPRNEKYPHGT